MSKSMGKSGYLTYCEIDLKAIGHNLKQIVHLASRNKFAMPTRPRLRKRVKGIETVLPVIKADAYGHGVKTIALLLDKKNTWQNILDIVQGFDELIVDIEYLSTFENEKIGQDKKSLAFRIIFNSNKKTLTSKEVDQIMNRLIKKLEDQLDAKLRQS